MKELRPTRVLLLGLFLVTLATPARAAGVHLRLQPATVTVVPNQEFDVELSVFMADDPFNAFDAAIQFDPAMLTFVPAANPATQQGTLMTSACANRFHLFNAAPDSLLTNLSLLCANVTVTGPGVIYHVRFRAGSTTGPTTVTFGPSTRFYRAGFFVSPLETQSMQVCVNECSTTDVGDAPASGVPLLAPVPNPWPAGRTARFDFAMRAAGPATLELFDTAGRKLAHRGPEWCEAGSQSWTLEAPAGASGVCFARLLTRAGTSHRTIVLLR